MTHGIARLPSQLQNVTSLWLVPNYTAWWQRHTGVSSLPKDTVQWCQARTQMRNHESQVRCPTDSGTISRWLTAKRLGSSARPTLISQVCGTHCLDWCHAPCQIILIFAPPCCVSAAGIGLLLHSIAFVHRMMPYPCIVNPGLRGIVPVLVTSKHQRLRVCSDSAHLAQFGLTEVSIMIETGIMVECVWPSAAAKLF